MVEVRIGTNESGQRLDRFLRKYLPKAHLSFIYRAIRKDVKVNGKREKNTFVIGEGDVVTIYLKDEDVESLRRKPETRKARKTFRVAYEDEKVLICDKPKGLLVHGDKMERQDHLTNQVTAYLAEKGEYDPASEKTFAPAPVNRIDRNTTGLVVFAKDYDTLKKLNEEFRKRGGIRKFYLTIVKGVVEGDMILEGEIEKDEERNVSRMVSRPVADQKREPGDKGVPESTGSQGKSVITKVHPLSVLSSDTGEQTVTVCEVEIETGRTHQIRVQLSDAGHPLVGDPKYGDRGVNRYFAEKYGVNAQLLTAYRLLFSGDIDIPGLSGREVRADLPRVFRKIEDDMGKGEE